MIDIAIVDIIEMYSGGNKMAMRIKIWWLTGWKFAIKKVVANNGHISATITSFKISKISKD